MIKRRPQASIAKTSKGKKPTDFTKNFRADFFTIRKVPISDAALDRLAELMIEWATSSITNVVFQEFLVLQRVPYEQLSTWMKRSEKLRKAKDFTLMVLGVNREKGAIFKQLDGNVVKQMQHRYDPEWKESEKHHARLKREESENTTEVFEEALSKILKSVEYDKKKK